MLDAAGLSKLAGVFGVAFFEFFVSIPGGLAVGLSPVLVAVTAWLSYTLGVIVIVLIGEPLRVRILARFGGKVAPDPNSRIRKAWDRYGVLGLSLLAPITTGAQIGAVIGLSFGAPPRRLILGMSLGAAVWAIILTVVALVGVTAVKSMR